MLSITLASMRETRKQDHYCDCPVLKLFLGHEQEGLGQNSFCNLRLHALETMV